MKNRLPMSTALIQTRTAVVARAALAQHAGTIWTVVDGTSVKPCERSGGLTREGNP